MRRPLLQPLIALGLVALFVAPVAAVEPGGSGKETLKGTLDALYVETFKEAHPQERYELRTADGQVPLEFADGGPEGLDGARVEVTGKRVGKTLHVAGSRPGRDLKVLRTASEQELGALQTTDGDGGTTTADGGFTTAATVTKNIAVILINFKDNTAQPFSKSTVQAAMTSSATSVKKYVEEEGKGSWTVNATVHGWYTLDTPSSSCNWSTWATMGGNAATAAGINLSGFTNFIYIVPSTSACGWAGVAYVNGAKSVLNGNYSVQVMTHELGHNWGLGHSNALYCTSGVDPGHDRRARGLPVERLPGPVLDDGQQRPAPQPRIASRRARPPERVPEGHRRPGQHLHDRLVLRQRAREAGARARAATAPSSTSTTAPPTATSTRSPPVRRRSPA